MLAGSLNEFTMLDVFSLLATTRKTGIVNLVADPDGDPGGADVTGRVWVTSGQIAYAVADVSRAPLVARLLHSGEIAESAIADLVAAHAADQTVGLPMLLDSLGIPDDRVRSVVCDQVIDALFDMSRWADGNFSFSARTASTSTEAPPPAHPTFDSSAIMDAVQDRLQEWKMISEAVPSRDLVPGLVTKATINSDGFVHVDPDHWEILTLVNGTRTVADVIELTGQGVYTVSKRLAEMVEAGLVSNADRRNEGPAVAATLQLLKGAEQRTLGASLSAAPPGDPGPDSRWEQDAPAESQVVAQAEPVAPEAQSWDTELPALPEAPVASPAATAMPAADMPPRQAPTATQGPADEAADWAASGPPAITPQAEVDVIGSAVEEAQPPAPIVHDEGGSSTSVQVNDDLLSRLIGGISRG